jgi:predicted enzyme related to lactoylglutathione lyase
MNQGIRITIYPIKEIARAKNFFGKMLGIEPYADEQYYVGFRIGEQEIGLLPNGHDQGMTGPLSYFQVNDINSCVKTLVDAGAQVQQDVKDVGGGISKGHR